MIISQLKSQKLAHDSDAYLQSFEFEKNMASILPEIPYSIQQSDHKNSGVLKHQTILLENTKTTVLTSTDISFNHKERG